MMCQKFGMGPDFCNGRNDFKFKSIIPQKPKRQSKILVQSHYISFFCAETLHL